MKGNVPMLKGIEVGVDFLHSPRSYDIILMVKLENKEELDKYQNDPYHCDVVKAHMHSVASSSIALDFEIGESNGTIATSPSDELPSSKLTM